MSAKPSLLKSPVVRECPKLSATSATSNMPALFWWNSWSGTDVAERSEGEPQMIFTAPDVKISPMSS
jgi:hypothetical protein